MAASAASTSVSTDFGDVSSLAQISRPERARIASDTLNILKVGGYRLSNGSQINLTDDVTFSNDHSILYTEDDLENIIGRQPTIDQADASTSAKIEIRQCTTLQAARSLAVEMDEERVGVLNFASAKNPGGGFLGGSQAQEESLARSSSLYLALTQARFTDGFYDYHRRGERGVYSHRMVYSPRVTIFKDDNGQLLTSPYRVSMITSAAPNAGVIKQATISRNVMTERVRRLLHVFRENKHDCLVLGAFGCGVFKNNPHEVAVIFREHLESAEFRNSFKRVVFAVTNSAMCQLFEEVFAAADVQSLYQQFGSMTFSGADRKHCASNHRNQQNQGQGKQLQTRRYRFDKRQGHPRDNYGDDYT